MSTLDIATAPRWLTPWTNGTTTWAELLDRFAHPGARGKEAEGGYVLGRLDGITRDRAHIIDRCALTLDSDDAGCTAAELVARLDCRAAAHSTWKHTPDKPRLRLVIPLDRPADPDEYTRLADAMMDRIGGHWPDRGGREPERFMYWPATPDPSTYQWAAQDGPLLAVDDLLASLPTPEPPKPPEPPRAPLRLDLGGSDRYLEATVRNVCERLAACGEGQSVTPGTKAGRENGTHASAVVLGNYVAGAGLSRAVAEEALLDAARRNGIAAEAGEKSIREQIRRGLDYGEKTPKGVPERVEEVAQNGAQDAPGAQDGTTPGDPQPAQRTAEDVMAELVAQELRKLIVRERARALYADSQRPPAEPFDADTLAGLLARPPEPLARIDGLLPWQAAALIVAQRKTGKTTLVANLARSLVTGEDFLDRFGVRAVSGRVGVLNYEVSGAQFARWADDAGVPRDRLFVVNLRGRRNPLAHPEDRERLAGLLRAREVETLIVDPFGRAYSGESQNDAGQVGAWLTGLDLFARSEVGALDVILTAHAGWNGERSRGSTALEDWADAVWTMTRDEEDDARYLRAIGRDVDLEEDRLAYDATTRRLSLSGAGGRRQAAQGRKVAELVEWVVKAVTGHPGGLGVEDLRKAIKAMPGAPTFRRDEVPKAAERARDEGRIQIVGGGAGQRKLHYPVVIPNPSQPVPTRPGDDRKPVPSPIWGTGTGGTGRGESIGDGSGQSSTPCPGCGGPLSPDRAAAGYHCLDCYRAAEVSA